MKFSFLGKRSTKVNILLSKFCLKCGHAVAPSPEQLVDRRLDGDGRRTQQRCNETMSYNTKRKASDTFDREEFGGGQVRGHYIRAVKQIG